MVLVRDVRFENRYILKCRIITQYPEIALNELVRWCLACFDWLYAEPEQGRPAQLGTLRLRNRFMHCLFFTKVSICKANGADAAARNV